MVPDWKLLTMVARRLVSWPGPRGPSIALATSALACLTEAPVSGERIAISEAGLSASSARIEITEAALRKATAAAVNTDVINAVIATAEKAHRWALTCRSVRGGSRIAWTLPS